jgi:hypothetical protein
MSSKEPTKEQQQKFWEYFDYSNLEWVDGIWCERIDKGLLRALPISMDTLFKYAVPKALAKMRERGIIFAFIALCDQWYNQLVRIAGDSNDVSLAALALFWAIQEVINEQ